MIGKIFIYKPYGLRCKVLTINLHTWYLCEVLSSENKTYSPGNKVNFTMKDVDNMTKDFILDGYKSHLPKWW